MGGNLCDGEEMQNESHADREHKKNLDECVEFLKTMERCHQVAEERILLEVGNGFPRHRHLVANIVNHFRSITM